MYSSTRGCPIDWIISIFSKNIQVITRLHGSRQLMQTENVHNVAGFAKVVSIRNSRLYGYIK